MRTLNIDELSHKISDYSSDIKYTDRQHLEIKIDQFFNFLIDQSISKRILQRIEEDFNDIERGRIEVKSKLSRAANETFKQTLKTREQQGAFGYFEIRNKFSEEKKYSNHYINLATEWYNPRGGGYDLYHEYFNTHFFEPFIELLEWYLSESKVKNDIDYYSYEEIKFLDSKFEELRSLILQLGMGQQIVFEETEEVKDLVKGLNKKNWYEIIRAKFIDLALSKAISPEGAETIIKFLTGEEINIKGLIS